MMNSRLLILIFAAATVFFQGAGSQAASPARRAATGRRMWPGARAASSQKAAPVPAGPTAQASAVLREDGSLAVETVLSLPEGVPGSFAVDVAGFDSLAEVGVETAGVPAVGTRLSVERSKGVAMIRWQRVPGDEKVKRKVRYVLGGAVTPGRTSDSLSWSVISPAQEFGFQAVTAFLRCPQGKATVVGGAEITALTPIEAGMALAVEKLPAGAPLRIMVSLPKGSVRSGFLWTKFMKNTGGTVVMFLLPLVSFLGLLGVFWSRGRDTVPKGSEEPAEGEILPPEIAGTVADEYVDSRDLAAAVLDMARLGFLELEYAPGHDGRAAALTVKGAKPVEGLEPHRRSLAGLLIAPDSAAGSGEGARVLDAVYAETARRGFFRENPAAERKAYTVAGVVLLCLGILCLAAGETPLRFFLGVVAGFAAPFFMARAALSAECPCMRWGLSLAAAVVLGVGFVSLEPFIGAGGVNWLSKTGTGLMLSSFFFFAFAPAMPQRTAQGSAEKARLLSHRLGLEMFLPPADKDQRDVEFQKGLPYSAVFQIRTDWVRRFAGAGAGAPLWWKRRAPDGSTEAPKPLAEVQADFLASLDLLLVRVEDLMPSGSGG
ncbi:MAG: DUF2207 domain-containing protein [Elusimicrobia bacterium]|nr:DUF2207 domain-containing protein [Elusimicrobiota bacterium]